MSNGCPRCGATLERVQRSALERLMYRRVLRCRSCGFRACTRRMPFESQVTFVLSRYTRCIRCGSYRVRRLPRRDRIDAMSASLPSVLQGLTRAPIYHCGPCRLQYYDWRSPAPGVREQATAAAPIGTD